MPGDCRDLALLVAQYHSHIHRAKSLRPDTIVKLFDRCDLWRKPERFALILETCISDAHGRTGHEEDDYPQAGYLLECACAARAVNAGDIARSCPDKNLIADKVREARIVAVEEVVRSKQ